MQKQEVAQMYQLVEPKELVQAAQKVVVLQAAQEDGLVEE